MILVLPSMTIKLSIVRKKKRVLLNVTKVRLEVMLVLHNVIMEMSNLRIKNRVPLNVTKIKSDVMLVLHNVTIGYGNFCLTRGYSARLDPNGSDFTWLDK